MTLTEVILAHEGVVESKFLGQRAMLNFHLFNIATEGAENTKKPTEYEKKQLELYYQYELAPAYLKAALRKQLEGSDTNHAQPLPNLSGEAARDIIHALKHNNPLFVKALPSYGEYLLNIEATGKTK
jgi:hypothetical protein